MRNIRILYTDNEGRNETSDIADIVESFTISTSIGGQCGKCELSIIGDGAAFHLGSRVQIYDGTNGAFQGWLFSVSMSDSRKFRATCYDQTRYLRNVDVMVYKEKTINTLFEDICASFSLKTGTIDTSDYVLPSAVCEGKALWDVMQEAIDHTLAYTKRLFVIRDNFGALELRDIENLRTDFVIDDENVGMGFDYNIGIDKETYNQVRLGYEDKDAAERKWGFVYDQDLIDRWGTLQLYKLLKGPMSEAQLEDRATAMLQLRAKPSRTVRLNCFGDFRIFAGCGVSLQMERILAFKGLNRFYVSSCQHTVSNDKHTMRLTLAIDSFGG